MSIVQTQFGQAAAWDVVEVGSTAAALTEFRSAAFGLHVTNNGAAPVYIGYDDTVSPSKFIWRLLPGDFLELLGGDVLLRQIRAVTAAGTVPVSVAVMR
jgi:hypothetical protein